MNILKLACVSLFMLFSAETKAQKPIVSAGTIRYFEKVPGTAATLPFVVWLPPSYNATKRYPVIYMHDGQMLFDATSTWNKQEWQVDESMSDLILTDSNLAAIVVGIWNSGENRFRDYFPQKVFESLSPEEQDSISFALQNIGRINGSFHPASDAYLRFVVNELKPFIDHNFSTRNNRESTFMAGSSMGGLISLYAMCEYPGVFGGIACLSTHWTGIHRNSNNPFPSAMLKYLKEKLPISAQGHRIYIDTGTEALDSLYMQHHEAACSLITSKDYTHKSAMGVLARGEDHSEKAWSKRFPDAIRFMLSRE